MSNQDNLEDCKKVLVCRLEWWLFGREGKEESRGNLDLPAMPIQKSPITWLHNTLQCTHYYMQVNLTFMIVRHAIHKRLHAMHYQLNLSYWSHSNHNQNSTAAPFRSCTADCWCCCCCCSWCFWLHTNIWIASIEPHLHAVLTSFSVNIRTAPHLIAQALSILVSLGVCCAALVSRADVFTMDGEVVPSQDVFHTYFVIFASREPSITIAGTHWDTCMPK